MKNNKKTVQAQTENYFELIQRIKRLEKENSTFLEIGHDYLTKYRSMQIEFISNEISINDLNFQICSN